MNNFENTSARLAEIEALQAYLETRKSELSVDEKSIAEAEALFYETHKRNKANARLIQFLKQFGYVVLDACGSSENAFKETKKDRLSAIASIIAKNSSSLLPAMEELYRAFNTKSGMELANENQDVLNQFRNLLQELKQAGIVESFQKSDTGFSATLTRDVLSRAKNRTKDSKTKQSWIRSGWAEKTFLYLVEKTFRTFSKERGFPVDFYWNVCVSDKPPYSKTSTEFDILVWFADKWYVFESKAGSTLSVVRWVDRWHMFGEDKADRKATIIQCAIHDFQPQVFSPLQIFCLQSFENSLTELLNQDFAMERAPSPP